MLAGSASYLEGELKCRAQCFSFFNDPKNIMKRYRSLAWFLLLVPIASCNQGTDTSLNTGGGSAGMWTIPGVGTTYVYQLTAPGDTAVENDTIVVTANGQHVGGKSNVIRIATFVAGQAQQGGFYAIESNGDISLGDYLTSFPDSITWATYPTGSHKTKTTSVDSFSFSEHIVRSDVLSF